MVNEAPIPYSIVLPARNEEQTIEEVLCAVRGMTDDLIVVDGHSSDRTVAIAKEYADRVVQDHGRGKGDAVRVGLATARHPITVFIDTDGSHDPKDIPKLVGPIAAGEADLVMGSRMLGGSEELFGSISEVIRLLGSLVISLSINYRYGVRLTDYQNGFRAIRTEVGRTIGLTSDITTVEQEMAMKCLKHGYRVTERPAHEYRRKGGVSKINVMRAAHIYVWNLICGVLGPRRVRASSVMDTRSPASPDIRGSTIPLPSASPPPTCPSCGSPADQAEVAHRRDLQLHRCDSCGLVCQASPPSAAEIVTTYGDDYYNYWGLEQSFDDLWEMKTKTCLAYLDLLERYLPQGLSAPQILDIGCAHGFMLEAARQKGFQAFGIEISPAASVARERGFTVYDRPLHELALPAERFDVITIIDVLEHIPDLQGFMKEVSRILKPDGTMLIVTPDVGSWIAKIMKAKWPHYKREHIFYFSQSSLSSLLGRTGFSVEFRPGFKYLSYEYILQHFQRYTGGGVTAVLTSIYPVLPLALARRPVRFPTEMLAIAQRGTT